MYLELRIPHLEARYVCALNCWPMWFVRRYESQVSRGCGPVVVPSSAAWGACRLVLGSGILKCDTAGEGKGEEEWVIK